MTFLCEVKRWTKTKKTCCPSCESFLLFMTGARNEKFNYSRSTKKFQIGNPFVRLLNIFVRKFYAKNNLYRINVIHKSKSSVATTCRSKALWLAVPRHVNIFNQAECFYHQSTVKFANEIGSWSSGYGRRQTIKRSWVLIPAPDTG